MKKNTDWLFAGCLALAAVACGSSNTDDVPPVNAAADLLYVGECSPADCDGQGVPEIACASGETRYVCGATNGSACFLRADCPGAGPDAATSFSACEEAQCGPTPGARSEECPDGYAWSAAQCGSFDGATCAWADQCAKIPAAGAGIDASQVRGECGQNSKCGEGESCVRFTAGSGLDGLYCVVGDGCAAIRCPADKCQVLESWPVQLRCAD